MEVTDHHLAKVPCYLSICNRRERGRREKEDEQLVKQAPRCYSIQNSTFPNSVLVLPLILTGLIANPLLLPLCLHLVSASFDSFFDFFRHPLSYLRFVDSLQMPWVVEIESIPLDPDFRNSRAREQSVSITGAGSSAAAAATATTPASSLHALHS